jgi:signal transduction histidine kinase
MRPVAPRIAHHEEHAVLGLIHDLRSPVAAAARAFQVLEVLLGQADESTREFRDAVRASLRSAERVATDWQHALLLDAVTPGARDTVEIEPLVRALLLELGLARDGAAEVSIRTLPAVRGRTADVRLVFRNLLDNARRYRRPGAPLRIAVGGEPDGAFARLWVRDNGRGIAATEIRRISDGHWRAPASSAGGLGLGLDLVRRVVVATGGRLWISSRVGRGTIVRFTLPRAACARRNPAGGPTAA